MPRPVSFVVKNGSKILSRVAGDIPMPVSVTASITCGPGDATLRRLGLRRIEIDVRRLDRQRSTVRHRIARVHHEIHEHLLELTTIGLHHA